ncbi:lysylphosphatidylglycerol synthase transmembrane domain-containing protein [Algoriphagus namhaensis]|uniref:Lysylphosphatidylglycerol synthase transmembrane domain-containing protein n=1 Tax=Algoriphagus namhaensis TaxID=915353 RepID=A0ABV8ASE3_9BACT
MKLPPKLKKALQLILSLGVALWIFWFLYKDIELDSFLAQIKSSKWHWILGSLAVSLIGFWIRGWRWTLLISKDEGKAVTASRAYHAVMVGYLVNLLVPRAGEVARCGVLQRTNKVPMGHLIGTVILERTIDFVFLLATIFLAFSVENQLFIELAGEFIDLDNLREKAFSNLPVVFGGFVVFVLTLYWIGRRFRDHGLVQKIQHFFREVLGGVKQIKNLQNPLGFWLSSIVIWVIYFMTMYMVSMAIQSTAILSMGEVLLVMVMGSIGMIAPVQGGIGTFHALVALILIQFGIAEADGKIFAAIIHGSQMILMVLAGLLSWFWMLRLPVESQPEQA